MAAAHPFATQALALDVRELTDTAKIIVFDIGGTNFRHALFSPKTNTIISEPEISATPSFVRDPGLPIPELQRRLVEQIVHIIQSYKRTQHDILSIVGISFPGPITSDGLVRAACSLWGNEGRDYSLSNILSEHFPDMRFIIANDLTAATTRYASMPEYATHEGEFHEVITVSTGIGGKVFGGKNSEVLIDKEGIGGEPGHAPVNFAADAALCDCGAKGDLNAEASGRSIERLARRWAKEHPYEYAASHLSKIVDSPDKLTNLHIVEAIKAKDILALKLLDQTTYFMAIAMAHASATLGVKVFIFIGGFARALDHHYTESLMRNLIRIDFFRLNFGADKLSRLVHMGHGDDHDNLIGIGILTARKAGITQRTPAKDNSETLAIQSTPV